MAKEKRLFYRRAFLNKPDHHSTGAIIAKVTRRVYRGSVTTVDVRLSISDCHRKIELDFYGGGTVAHRANDMFKLNLLVDTVTRVRDLLEAEYERIPPSLSEID